MPRITKADLEKENTILKNKIIFWKKQCIKTIIKYESGNEYHRWNCDWSSYNNRIEDVIRWCERYDLPYPTMELMFDMMKEQNKNALMGNNKIYPNGKDDIDKEWIELVNGKWIACCKN